MGFRAFHGDGGVARGLREIYVDSGSPLGAIARTCLLVSAVLGAACGSSDASHSPPPSGSNPRDAGGDTTRPAPGDDSGVTPDTAVGPGDDAFSPAAEASSPGDGGSLAGFAPPGRDASEAGPPPLVPPCTPLSPPH